MNNKIVTFDGQIEQYKPNLTKLLENTHTTPEKFIATAQNLVRRIPKLLDCDQASFFGSMMKAAELGLSISDFKGECYILPYGSVAQFQIGYQGFITMLYRSKVSSIRSAVVYENDHFEYEMGLDQKLKHIPAERDRGAPIGVYAIAGINGDKIFKYMTQEDIERFMNLSQAATGNAKKYSPWHSDKDPENWMWQKTVIKQIAKLLPKSAELSSAIHADDIAETGGSIRMVEDKIIIDEPNVGANIAKNENDKAEAEIFEQ